ncbi:VOC family protein [Modestobacter marinus]|uniref:VOC family protein n=1 Tax=Modestobacter marinus TaxID=477641 RepID=UPI001C98B8CF|nr:hypothetical protein [Modestobacter marinus]
MAGRPCVGAPLPDVGEPARERPRAGVQLVVAGCGRVYLSEVHDLKAKGVVFEVYEDMPGVTWDGEVATIEGMGRAAWFKDSEGNVLCVDQETTAG